MYRIKLLYSTVNKLSQIYRGVKKRKKFALTLLFASMLLCFPWLSVASDASVAPEIKELQDKDTGVVLKVWSERTVKNSEYKNLFQVVTNIELT